MKLLLTRHGETIDNTRGVTMGQSNSSLTQQGIRQINDKAASLADVSIDAIYSSDLGRCAKTARLIQKKYPNVIPLTLSLQLREISFGVYEGQVYEVLRAKPPYRIDEPFEGGESNDQMMKRVIGFVNEIIEKHPDETVLVVTHSGPIAAITAAIKKVPFSDTLKTKIGFKDVLEFSVNGPL